MSEEESNECGADLTTKDGVCDRTPSMPDGKCKYHTEHETGMDRDWKPNYSHGLYQDRGSYYQNLPEEDQQFIDAVTDDLINKSHFDKSDISALEKCRQVAIDLHQRRRADEYIHKKGLTQTSEVGFHEQYGVMEEEQENVLFITKDRLSRESRMTMKDLGIFDDDSDAGSEGQSLIETLSKELQDAE